MSITNNLQVSTTPNGGALYKPVSGADVNELAELSVIFVYQPVNYPGLRIVLRAEPALLPTPAGGKRLGYIYRMTGSDGDLNKDGDSIRGRMLGTEVPIDEAVVTAALSNNKNPVVAVFESQKDLFEDFCQNSDRLKTAIQQLDFLKSIADPGVSGGNSGRI